MITFNFNKLYLMINILMLSLNQDIFSTNMIFFQKWILAPNYEIWLFFNFNVKHIHDTDIEKAYFKNIIQIFHILVL